MFNDIKHSKHVKSGVVETQNGFQFVSCEPSINEDYIEENDKDDIENSIDYSCDYIKNENESESEESVWEKVSIEIIN